MAAINLTPDIPVIIGQGTLFTIAYFLVKKWIMQPYYLLAAKRSQLTKVGDDYDDIFAKIDERNQKIEAATKELYSLVQQIRKDASEAALSKAKLLISEAQEEADQLVRESASQVSRNYQQQSENIDQFAAPLAGLLYTQVVGFSKDS